MDDVFDQATTTTTTDLPAVRRQHVTAGYRDGISSAKHAHVQHGFDAGFPVGAQLGMRAGVVLGVLEGVVSANSTDERAKELYERAKRELVVQKVFVQTTADGKGDVCQELEGSGEAVVGSWEETVRQLLEGIRER